MRRRNITGLAAAAVVTAAGAVAAAAGRRDSPAPPEGLEPEPPAHSTARQVTKPTPEELFAPRGTGTDFETRLSALDGYLTPTDRFYVRSHSPTPSIDASTWRLRVDGDGVRSPTELSYSELRAMPQVTCTRVIECAGNGRRFFKEAFGSEAEGTQWRTGAIGAAEWGGVRLAEVLERAGLVDGVVDVMAHGLDDHHVARPIPLTKALADDTLVALDMNGEPLPPDHGFPARMLVPGWLGTASIKWVGRIEVATRHLYSPYNTAEYVLMGPAYRPVPPAAGEPISEMPVMSVVDLDWPARVPAGANTVWGRAYAGEGRVCDVEYRIDDGGWEKAELVPPNIEGAWVRWRFGWDAPAGSHEIRVRATDERGRTQPEAVEWNDHGFLYNAVVALPVTAG